MDGSQSRLPEKWFCEAPHCFIDHQIPDLHRDHGVSAIEGMHGVEIAEDRQGSTQLGHRTPRLVIKRLLQFDEHGTASIINIGDHQVVADSW